MASDSDDDDDVLEQDTTRIPRPREEAPPEEEAPEEEDEDDAMPSMAAAEAMPSTLQTERPKRPKFEPNDLTKKEGLEWVLENLPTKAKFEGTSSDGIRLIEGYRAWAAQLFPRLAFDEFLSRVDKFGTKAQVRNQLETMRQDILHGRKRPRDDDSDDDDEVMDLTTNNKDEEVPPAEDEEEDESPLAPPPDEEHPSQEQEQEVTHPSRTTMDDEAKAKIEANRLAALEKRRQRLALAAEARAT